MISSVRISISGDTEIVVRGQVPKTLSSFVNFLEMPIAGTTTLKQILQNNLKEGEIHMKENKPANFYVSRDFLSNPPDLFMLTIETEEDIRAAIFSLPLSLPDSDTANAGGLEKSDELIFNERHLPQSLIPPCQMFVPALSPSSAVSGWIKVDKDSEEWKLYALRKTPIANAMGVGAVVDSVAVVFGAPLQDVVGSQKAGRGTCVIRPSDPGLPWFFFASGKITNESIRIANRLAKDSGARIILHDPNQNQIWDLMGQKSPQPTQLPNTHFALFVPDAKK